MKTSLPVLCIAVALAAGCNRPPSATDAAPLPTANANLSTEAAAVDTTNVSAPVPSGDAMPAELTDPMIRMVASMAVVGSACEGGDISGSLERAREHARAEMIANGVPAADFDRKFDAAQAESTRKLQAMSAQQRAEVCAQLRQTAEQMKADVEATGPRVAN
ncbi:hypothetical protein ACFFGH_00775 [Lysobacter korlensis]|uniref:DUF4168 domain-containing protein n=1 Tax=Lysobacter korlensis TaxID=553636 RepID=A0ABV6RHC0_9GAMM